MIRGFSTLLVFAFASTSLSVAAQTSDLDKSLKGKGFRLYDPPRDNWGPGTVFEGSVSGRQLKVIRPVCPALFSTVLPSGAGVVLSDYSAVSEKDASLGISLLEKVIGANNSAALKAEYKSPKNVNVKWGDVTEQSYFASSIYKDDGQVADVNGKCRMAINDYKRRGKVKNLYVIDRALVVSTLSYSFKKGSDATPATTSASADLSLAGIIKINIGGSATMKSNTILEIKKPMYIGYAKPARIDKFLPQGQVSGSRVKVKIEPAGDLIIE